MKFKNWNQQFHEIRNVINKLEPIKLKYILLGWSFLFGRINYTAWISWQNLLSPKLARSPKFRIYNNVAKTSGVTLLNNQIGTQSGLRDSKPKSNTDFYSLAKWNINLLTTRGSPSESRRGYPNPPTLSGFLSFKGNCWFHFHLI